jgi:ABC-type transport system involved in multi-copper enzyme maturation permease subunit
MKKLLTIEIIKLRKLLSVKIIFLVYMLVVPSWMLFMDFFFKLNPELKPIFTSHNLFEFPYVWSFTTYSASFFNILLAVIIVTITTMEIQAKTMRQHVIDGLTSRQVITAKFIVILMLGLLATIYTGLCAFVIGSINNGVSNAFPNIHLVFLYFIQTIGYFSFAFLFALLIKRSALAIVLFIVYFPVETIVGNIISSKIYQFFPLKVYADLTPTPFFEQLIKLSEKARHTTVWVMSMNQKVLLSLFYILVCFVVTNLYLRKRDF